MQLLVKNKIVSLKGSSFVTNEAKEKVFIVNGKLISPTRKKFIKDKDGKLLYIVRNKFWRLFLYKAFIYDANKVKIATVVRKFSLKAKFEILGTDRPFRIDGNILGWNFDIIFGDEVIGHISRKVIALSDQFMLDVKHDEDAPFLVALVIALDNIVDNMQDSRD